jgi:hypothetical protein
MASYPPYLPPSDPLFATWLQNFSTLTIADPALYGLSVPDAAAVEAANDIFQAAYILATDPATRTAPTVAAKDVARASAEAVTRPYAVQVSRNASVTDANKLAVGVTVPSLVPTPIPAPVEAPIVGIQSATPLNQLLTYSVAGVVGKSKPFGAIGTQIFRVVGVVAATDPAQALYDSTVTKSPFRQGFDSEDQGKLVTYFARFITRSGSGGEAQPGPWSAPLTLTVM